MKEENLILFINNKGMSFVTIETTIIKRIHAIFERFPNYWSEGVLIKSKVIEALRNYNSTLIEAILNDEVIRNTYTIKVNENIVFKQDEFIDFFRYKDYWDSSYTRYSNEIGLSTEGKYLKYNSDVVLDFPYKDSVLEAGMTKEDCGKQEIFYHEVIAKEEIDVLLAPKLFTNIKKITIDGAKEVTSLEKEDNFVVKGNNLIALHSLKSQYQGSVKLIYIDPPYNTEEDSFNYNDRFKHSTWLTFMKNRLEIAKEFLTSDGFIFIQINDKEQAYLKVLCDDVFGRENFLTNICVKMSHLSGPKMAHKDKKIPKIKEFILVYAKDKGNVKFNPEYVSVSWDEAFDRYNSFLDTKGCGEEQCDKWEIITVNEALKRNGIDKSENPMEAEKFKINNSHLIFRTARNRSFDFSPYPRDTFTLIKRDDDTHYFIYKGEDVLFASSKIKEIAGIRTPVAPIGDIWMDIGINNLSNEGGVSLRFGKKPESLLKRIINMTTQEGDLVMDFFLGSGTTVATAHKMKRRYIGIEQLDYAENDSIVRLQNVIKGESSGISKLVNWQGGGSFVYAELNELNQYFVNRVKKASNDIEVNSIVEEILDKAYLNFQVDLARISMMDESFKELTLEEKKRIILGILDENQAYVNYSEIDDVTYGISEKEKMFNHSFYDGNEGR
jgi:adenine-specific DNA-methyltransferase